MQGGAIRVASGGEPAPRMGRAERRPFLAIFQAPNKFFQSDGAVTDFLGRDWKETWGSKG